MYLVSMQITGLLPRLLVRMAIGCHSHFVLYGHSKILGRLYHCCQSASLPQRDRVRGSHCCWPLQSPLEPMCSQRNEQKGRMLLSCLISRILKLSLATYQANDNRKDPADTPQMALALSDSPTPSCASPIPADGYKVTRSQQSGLLLLVTHFANAKATH